MMAKRTIIRIDDRFCNKSIRISFELLACFLNDGDSMTNFRKRASSSLIFF